MQTGHGIPGILINSSAMRARRGVRGAALALALGWLCGQSGASADWRFVQPLPQGNDLFAAWAPQVDLLYAGGHGGVIMRWDGQTWATMETPTRKTVYAIHGTATNDIWAVGGDGYTTDDTDRCLVMHYDGTAWSEVTPPDYFGWTYPLHAVHAVTANDVWAANESGAILAHWDGSAWGYEFFPFGTEGGFRDITSSGPDHVYAVGTHGQIVHRDQGTWRLEQKTEEGNFTANLLNSVWAQESGGTQEVFAGGNFGQVYRRGAGAVWTEVDLNSGCFESFCEGLHFLWGTAPDDLYLLGADNIRHHNGSPPPIARTDFAGMLRGGWFAATATGDRIFLVGSSGVVHEYLLDGTGGGTLSPLTAGEPSLVNLGSIGAAPCGAGRFLIYGNTEYTSQHPLWLFDHGSLQQMPELPPGMPQRTIVRAALATGMDDIVLNWSGITSSSGTYHWDGSAWTSLNRNWAMVGFWRSAGGRLYACGQGDVGYYEGGAWTQVLPYGDLGPDVRLSAFAGVSDAELYVGSSDGRIWRYNGSAWNQETTPAGSGIVGLAAAGGDTYAVGIDGVAWRRSGGTWTQLADVDARTGDHFTDVETGDGYVLASQHTATGYTDGGLGRIWRFEGATASLVESGLSRPLDALVRDPDGVFFGIGSMNGATAVITDGPEPADLVMQRVDLSQTEWIPLGQTGVSLQPASAGASRPMVAAWSTPETPLFLDAESYLPAGRHWNVLYESAGLPEIYARFAIDPADWPEGFMVARSVLLRSEGEAWSPVATTVSPDETWLATAEPTPLSRWTYAAAIGEPVALALDMFHRAATGLELRWSDLGGGYAYTVLTRGDLSFGDWSAAPGQVWPISAPGWTNALPDAGARAYRVEAAPGN